MNMNMTLNINFGFLLFLSIIFFGILSSFMRDETDADRPNFNNDAATVRSRPLC